MNTQTLGALSSDQKIDKVFHAFGYSIPVGKDGRRLWPTKFKREMAQRMRSGTLSIGDVQKTCQISDKTAYAWRKGPKQKNLAKRPKVQDSTEEEPRNSSEAEQHIWQRVQVYMKDHRPYLDPDLTLSRLSRKLGIPAKTLSTVINQATGENVSRYVNDARIAAAQDALKDGESVTTAMLSSGFNTKSNFNREFLRITGSSPSKWLANVVSHKMDRRDNADSR